MTQPTFFHFLPIQSNTNKPIPMKPKTNSKPPSQKQLAEALGLTTRRVRQLAADGMPSDSIASALAWRMDSLPVTETDEALKLEKLRLLKSQANRSEHAAAVDQGKFIPRDHVEEYMTRIALALGAFITRIIAEFPLLAEGLPASRSRPIIKTKGRELQSMLANLESEFWISKPITEAETGRKSTDENTEGNEI
jgi:hypothetical protein